jgi:hypothetical protein
MNLAKFSDEKALLMMGVETQVFAGVQENPRGQTLLPQTTWLRH